MAATIRRIESGASAYRPHGGGGESLTTFPLDERHREEALAFLAARPVHTVYMAGCILDNGVLNPIQRGRFHGCRDAAGRLVGVALVGHATLIESQSAAAVASFARLARACPSAHLVRAEPETAETFWRNYAAPGQSPWREVREVLYEQREHGGGEREPARGLRRATADDLELVMGVNAAMAVEACGVSPAESDPVGFRVRTARRIEQGRVWVWREGARLVFKADVVAETEEVAYLEGVHVHPQDRGHGHGSRCLSALARELLAHRDAICLTVREGATGARAFYEKTGYRFRAYYDTIYLQPRGGA